jgi:hypothetical protein
VIYVAGPNGGEDSFSYVVEDTSGGRGIAKVQLTVSDAPQITGVSVSDGSVQLRFQGRPNTAYLISWSADGKNWTTLASGTLDANGVGEYKQSGGAGAHHRFYRLEWP